MMKMNQQVSGISGSRYTSYYSDYRRSKIRTQGRSKEGSWDAYDPLFPFVINLGSCDKHPDINGNRYTSYYSDYRRSTIRTQGRS